MARGWPRDDGEGDVDEERPPPAEVVDEEPAEERADDDRPCEQQALVPEPPSELTGRDEIAQDRHAEHREATPADALHRRAASSIGIDCANPQATEPRTNSPIANSSTRLRP